MMNINNNPNYQNKIIQSIILIIIISIIFYGLSEIIIDLLTQQHMSATENFCSGPHCKKHHRHSNRYDYNRYDYNDYRYYYNPYYGSNLYYYNPYYNYSWYNLWGYLPCITNASGGLFCW